MSTRGLFGRNIGAKREILGHGEAMEKHPAKLAIAVGRWSFPSREHSGKWRDEVGLLIAAHCQVIGSNPGKLRLGERHFTLRSLSQSWASFLAEQGSGVQCP